jgi:hypothetical protein
MAFRISLPFRFCFTFSPAGGLPLSRSSTSGKEPGGPSNSAPGKPAPVFQNECSLGCRPQATGRSSPYPCSRLRRPRDTYRLRGGRQTGSVSNTIGGASTPGATVAIDQIRGLTTPEEREGPATTPFSSRAAADRLTISVSHLLEHSATCQRHGASSPDAIPLGALFAPARQRQGDRFLE